MPRFILILFCWPLFLTSFQTTLQAEEYISLAKLIVGGAEVHPKTEEDKDIPEDFYITQIELLESSTLHEKATVRMRQYKSPETNQTYLSEDMQTPRIEVKVKRLPNSRIINIVATSSSPLVSQLFLNALQDELLAFRQMLRDQAAGKKLQVNLQTLVTKQQEMEKLGNEVQKAGVAAPPQLLETYQRAKTSYELAFKHTEELQRKLDTQAAHEVIMIMSRASSAVLLER